MPESYGLWSVRVCEFYFKKGCRQACLVKKKLSANALCLVFVRV